MTILEGYDSMKGWKCEWVKMWIDVKVITWQTMRMWDMYDRYILHNDWYTLLGNNLQLITWVMEA